MANNQKLGHIEWVEEKICGRKDWRKGKFGQVFTTLEKGGTVIVSELSRLGRSTIQILEIMKKAKYLCCQEIWGNCIHSL